jgi:hypothetical protein
MRASQGRAPGSATGLPVRSCQSRPLAGTCPCTASASNTAPVPPASHLLNVQSALDNSTVSKYACRLSQPQAPPIANSPARLPNFAQPERVADASDRRRAAAIGPIPERTISCCRSTFAATGRQHHPSGRFLAGGRATEVLLGESVGCMSSRHTVQSPHGMIRTSDQPVPAVGNRRRRRAVSRSRSRRPKPGAHG